MSGSRGRLGTNKDVEKLARQARRAGWTVEVGGGNHIVWTAPDGRSFRSALTTRVGVEAASVRRRLHALGFDVAQRRSGR